MNSPNPSLLWRVGLLMALTALISVALCVREQQPPKPPFNGGVDLVEVEGRVLLVHAYAEADRVQCTVTDKVEVAESPATVKIRVSLRDLCPEPERRLIDTWREEVMLRLWPRFGIGEPLSTVLAPVTLDKPLGSRKVVNQEGGEVRVCPITGSRLATTQRCPERGR